MASAKNDDDTNPVSSESQTTKKIKTKDIYKKSNIIIEEFNKISSNIKLFNFNKIIGITYEKLYNKNDQSLVDEISNLNKINTKGFLNNEQFKRAKEKILK